MNELAVPPHFLIIGVQKGGTTSLYNYLIQHPQIAPATHKEVHFFDLNFDKGVEWYKSQFPNSTESDRLLTGEASPYYIFHPHVPHRVYNLFPQIKIILLLRNPIERAISHYYYYVKIGCENLSLENAIAAEPQRLAGEIEKLIANETYYSYNHQHHAYLSRGIYADQLLNWMKFFPKEQILILKSEDLYTNPAATFNTALEFLNLPHHQLENYEKYNAGEYPSISQEIHQQLQAYFQPHNQRLAAILGTNFVNW
ncbi:sulfotransferase [Oscillatoriales cyanobacterium USR001]|nr:sulfotransferase [Oscillatoriales cyanobacterium USR001]